MKPIVTYVLLLLFIIAADADTDVKDSTGESVLDFAPYHIGPATPTEGGRIKLTDTMGDKKICPFNVVQDPEDNVGGEFMITLTAKRKYVRTSSPFSIDSGILGGECDESTYWTIPDAEGSPPSNLITTGGYFEVAITCFRLVEYPKPTNPKVHSYMLQHCPFVCGAGPVTCFNISIYEDNYGVKRLSTTGATPFEFVFYKVEEATYDSM